MNKQRHGKICIAGRNQICVDAIEYLLETVPAERLVICPSEKDVGISGWQPSVRRFAREMGLTVMELAEVEKVKDLEFISLEYDKIIKPDRFLTDRLYNMHFSALPEYKGMYTSALPILHGKKRTGVTFHKIDSGIDTGPIIKQSLFQIQQDWTARDLYFAYMKNGYNLFCEVYKCLDLEKSYKESAQGAEISTYYSRKSIDYSNIELDLNVTAYQLINQIRAYSFREYQTPEVQGFPIAKWRVTDARSTELPGTVVSKRENFIEVATIDYNVELYRARFYEWFDDISYEDVDRLDIEFIDIRDRHGWTPLIRAVWTGDQEKCKFLLEQGACPNFPNANGTTPLMYSLSSKNNGKKDIAKMLIKYGADIGRPDRFGKTLADYHPAEYIELAL